MPPPSVLVVVPVLDRPGNVRPLADSLFDSVGDVPLSLLFVASPGDDRELEAIADANVNHLLAPWPVGHGDWAKKINLAYRSTDEPWIFTGADDVCFCPGWADRALECAGATDAAVIGTQDWANPRVVRGDHATHNLVARWYADLRGTIDGPGAVVSEVYAHNFVDDELVETAKARGLWTFCPEAEVPHSHPTFDREVEFDATYRLGLRSFNDDRRTFYLRRAALRRERNP